MNTEQPKRPPEHIIGTGLLAQLVAAGYEVMPARRDEQAEVVGWVVDFRDGSAGLAFLAEEADAMIADATDGGSKRALYAAPSAVTEEMVEAALEAYRSASSYPIVPGNHAEAIRVALTAALAVGDEGIREGERLALLVEELADREKPGRPKLMLMIAARAVRRGRLLTPAEQLENVGRFLAGGEDADAVPSK